MIEQDERQPAETALLAGFHHKGTSLQEAEALLDELESLVTTMGLEVLGKILIKIDRPQARLYTGTGKAEEISEMAEELDADCIIFDDPLSPSQQRNWEEITGRCVIDRQEVILDIFAARASTREAVLQVALARMEYSLPRLTRAWTHLSRQKGGTKGTRGEGETQLEVDRRIVLRKISKLKKELIKIRKQRSTMRKRRETRGVPAAGLVGYTNAGKSSLLKALAGGEIFVEDKLFATLDPTTRRVELSEGDEILMTDTVGFVRKLPHGLVEAFRSTLEETLHSDFLIHVVDASSPEALDQAVTTLKVLEEIGIEEKEILTVFNKEDLLREEGIAADLIERFPEAHVISTETGSGMEELKTAIEKIIRESRGVATYLLPPDRYDLAAYIHRSGTIISEEHSHAGTKITARIPEEAEGRLANFRFDEE
ncbi:MAG: GTPase HflX [Spirochaetales bacterium]|nr:GTPase HflX [Spirochaetales bacterium]